MAARQALQDQENCLLFVNKQGKKRSKKEVNARMALALTYADYRAGVQRKLSSLHKDVYITSTWLRR